MSKYLVNTILVVSVLLAILLAAVFGLLLSKTVVAFSLSQVTYSALAVVAAIAQGYIVTMYGMQASAWVVWGALKAYIFIRDVAKKANDSFSKFMFKNFSSKAQFTPVTVDGEFYEHVELKLV